MWPTLLNFVLLYVCVMGRVTKAQEALKHARISNCPLFTGQYSAGVRHRLIRSVFPHNKEIVPRTWWLMIVIVLARI